MAHLRPLVRVRSVKPLDRFRVHLEFEDGTQREADLAVYLPRSGLRADSERSRLVSFGAC